MKWFINRNPSRRRSIPSACVVDSLEQRTLLTSWSPPTGDAQVFLRDGDLIVDNSQGTELFVEGGNIHAQPRSNFTQATVNGGANFSVNLDDFTGDIIVDGYFFYARGFTTPGRIVVQEDTSGFVQLDDMTVSGDLEVATQTEVSIVDTRVHGSASIRASRAYFISGLYRVSIAQDLIVSGTRQADSFSMTGGVVHGKTLIRTAGGRDIVKLDDIQFEGPTTVNTGSGVDTINSSENEFAKRLVFNGSKNTDFINSRDDSFSGNSYLKGGSGNDNFSIESPTVWGTDDFFSRFTIRGDGGDDSYEMTEPRFTEDRLSVSARRSVWEPQSEDEARAIALANSTYPASGGMPIHLSLDGDRRYVVTYPVRAERFFDSGRPRMLVDLNLGTVNWLPPSGGRSRPVEFTDLELEPDWWKDLPS